MLKEGLILVFMVIAIKADIYFHNPRGSNNRLDGNGRDVRNQRRLFDSQNNARGGYNVGSLYYYAGSVLPIEWTNQHSCGDQNNNCQLILQYMCDDKIRDGISESTIPDRKEHCKNQDCNNDMEFGMHENYDYYMNCKTRDRNVGLYTSDQKLRHYSAKYTRQNPNGNRRGYECPEERDYYPYHNPTPWKDIAIMTNDVKRCQQFQADSQNVKERYSCVPPKGYVDAMVYGSRQLPHHLRRYLPLNEKDCKKIEWPVSSGKFAEWKKTEAWGISAPNCIPAPTSRDNHNGNGIGGFPNMYNWTIPEDIHSHCVLRMRYNISTSDYDIFPKAPKPEEGENKTCTPEQGFCVMSNGRDQNSGVIRKNRVDGNTKAAQDECLKICRAYPGATGCEVIWHQGNRGCYVHTKEIARGNGVGRHMCWVFSKCGIKPYKPDIGSLVGLSEKEAEARGYVFKTNPVVKPFGDLDIGVRLAINTAQFGRTFEDRSHSFAIRKRPEELEGETIHNLNVRGKRGNAQQVYPAVEYDYVPNRLEAKVGDYIHFQWTGSNTNPRNNAGNGQAGSDRSNVLLLRKQNYPEGTPGVAVPENLKYGHWGNSYPENLINTTFLGIDKSDLVRLALSNVFRGELSQLDDSSPYFDLGPKKITSPGTFFYMCSRNNAFTNRSQKGKIIVKDGANDEFANDSEEEELENEERLEEMKEFDEEEKQSPYDYEMNENYEDSQ